MDRHADRVAALASLRARWGSAAPRPATEVFGALAAAPLPAEAGAVPALLPVPGRLPGNAPTAPPGALPGELPAFDPAHPALVPLPGGAEAAPVPAPGARPFPGGAPRGAPDTPRNAPGAVDRAIRTGFAELDGLLAAGGLPRAGTVALRGAGTSGATTLALRVIAEAQAGGALAAWVDLSRSLDPVEAVARGVRLEWLAVLVPETADEALAMAGSLLQARAVDILVMDLADARERAPVRPRPALPAARRPGLADRLARLVAFARRAGALLLVLEPAGVAAPLRAALAEGSSLALELCRTGWIRLGREVVGQRTEVRVAKDRHGAPDRRTAIRLLYAEGGPRDRCLARDELLAEEPVATRSARSATRAAPTAGTGPPPTLAPASSTPSHEPDRSTDAPPPLRLAPSRPPARAGARSRHPRDRAADPRRAAVG